MPRLFLITLQAVALVFGGLALAVYAAAFTPEGLLQTPSRINAGVFILSKMPVEGVPFLKILRTLLWVPLITAVVALPQSVPALRPLRWVGVAVNAAALGYLLHLFPGLVSPDKMPILLVGTALLFLVSALFLVALPRKADAASARQGAVFALCILWAGSVFLIGHGALGQNLPPQTLACVFGCLLALSLCFYCTAKAVSALGGKKSGNSAAFLLLPLAALAACIFFSPPLALPLGAALFLFLAVCMT